MKTTTTILALTLSIGFALAQAPKIYINFVSHNEPGNNLQTSLPFNVMVPKVLQLATIIDSKGAKLVTSHPADSYTLNKEKDKVVSIQITNAEKFWSASKYLVVVKE